MTLNKLNVNVALGSTFGNIWSETRTISMNGVFQRRFLGRTACWNSDSFRAF